MNCDKADTAAIWKYDFDILGHNQSLFYTSFQSIIYRCIEKSKLHKNAQTWAEIVMHKWGVP